MAPRPSSGRPTADPTESKARHETDSDTRELTGSALAAADLWLRGTTSWRRAHADPSAWGLGVPRVRWSGVGTLSMAGGWSWGCDSYQRA